MDMDFYTRQSLQQNYYEMAPDGESMLVVPIVRSLSEVIFEREIVAEYFAGGGAQKILAGVCDLFKAQLIFEDQGIRFEELKTPISLELQHKIDIYNNVTAEQVIGEYKSEQKIKEDRRRRREIRKKRPHSSMDRAQSS